MTGSEADVLDYMRRTFEKLPIAGLLSARPVSFDGDAGRVVIDYDARPEFCNLIGSVQGGMLTAMLDNAMSFAVLGGLPEGHVAPSLEIKTSYIAPAKPGRITGEGRVVRQGRTIAFLEGRLNDPDGRLLATATGTAQIRAPRINNI